MTKLAGRPIVDAAVALLRRVLNCLPEARDGSDPFIMSRRAFSSPAANIVVSTDGYFDVYPPTARVGGDRPAYRGGIAELGAGIRGTDDRLTVRPDSATLALAVEAWSAVHGAAAVRGEMGKGRGAHVA